MRTHLGTLGITLGTLVCGCGGGDDGDAGALADAADGATDGATGVATPMPPEAPSLFPCPSGWSETTSETGVDYCEPWPTGSAEDCTGAEVHLPGEPGCTPIGSACPPDGIPTELPTDNPVVYVRAGASGGDGSLGRPYGDFGRVPWSRLAAGTVIAVGPGRYDTIIDPPRDVTIWGACVEETVITSSTPPRGPEAVVTARRGAVELRNLQITGSPRVGAMCVGNRLTLRDVLVDGATAMGVLAVEACTLDAESLVVRNTQPMSGSDYFGRGLALELGSMGMVRRSSFEANHDLGVSVSGSGSHLTASQIVVRNTRPELRTDDFGMGLAVRDGASVEVDEIVVEGNSDSGLYVTEAGSSATFANAVVRDTTIRVLDGRYGSGIRVSLGAEARMSRALIMRSQTMGVGLYESSSLTLDDVVVADTKPGGFEYGAGFGLHVQLGSSLTAHRVLVEGSEEIGIAIHEESDARLEDVLVRDTTTTASTGQFGRGINAQLGARVSLSRVRVETSRGPGLSALTDGTTITGSDVTIVDSESIGISGQDGSSVELSRVLIERALGLGANARSAVFRFADITVRDTKPTADGLFGRGLAAELGGEATVSGGYFERNREVSLAALSGVLHLEDVQIVDTLERACAADTCADYPAGFGLLSGSSSAVDATRFSVARSALCGVVVTDDSTLDLSDGEVRESPIGACIQAPGYDAARLTDGVVYRDNDTNLDATELPVPEASGALELGEDP